MHGSGDNPPNVQNQKSSLIVWNTVGHNLFVTRISSYGVCIVRLTKTLCIILIVNRTIQLSKDYKSQQFRSTTAQKGGITMCQIHSALN